MIKQMLAFSGLVALCVISAPAIAASAATEHIDPGRVAIQTASPKATLNRKTTSSIVYLGRGSLSAPATFISAKPRAALGDRPADGTSASANVYYLQLQSGGISEYSAAPT